MAERLAMSLHTPPAAYDETSLADAINNGNDQSVLQQPGDDANSDVTLQQILGMSRDQKKQMLQVLFESFMDEPDDPGKPLMPPRSSGSPQDFPQSMVQQSMMSSMSSSGGYAQPEQPRSRRPPGSNSRSGDELATVPEFHSQQPRSCFQSIVEGAPMGPPPGLEDQVQFNSLGLSSASGEGIGSAMSKSLLKGGVGKISKSTGRLVSQPENKKAISDSEIQSGAPKKVDLQSKYHRHRGPVTTFMIRNIPCRITQQQMMELLDEKGFQGKYDFLYLPSGTKPVKPGVQPEPPTQGGISSSNLGYGFINLPEGEDAMMFQLTFQDYKFEATCSNKLCAIYPAHIQGLENNVKHFRRTAVKLTSFKPYIRTQSLPMGSKGKHHKSGQLSGADISDAESFSSIGTTGYYRGCKTDISDSDASEYTGSTLSSMTQRSGVPLRNDFRSSKQLQQQQQNCQMLEQQQRQQQNEPQMLAEVDINVDDIFE